MLRRLLPAVAGLLLVAPGAHAAGSLTLTSPTGGEIVDGTPEFSGTGFTDGISSVRLVVEGPSAFQTAAPVYGDGTWQVTGQQLTAGGYTAVACQQDSAGAESCTPAVAFTVRSSGDTSFTAKAPRGTFRDLLAGRLKLPVRCPQECTIAARLTVPAKDGRTMGIPGTRANPVLGQETDDDTFAAGSALVPLAPPSRVMKRRLAAALAFPLFSSLVIKVEVQADWGEGSVFTSVTGRLRWPSPPVADGRDGTILDIDPPGTVSATARSARFQVRLARGRSLPVAGVRTAGAAVDVRGEFLTRSGKAASPAALRRGGTFVVAVAWDEEAARDAASVTPIAAEAWVRRGKSRAARRFTLG